MSRSTKKHVYGTWLRVAGYDNTLAARFARHKQNQAVREKALEEDFLVPHKFECPFNNVYSWRQDGKKRYRFPHRTFRFLNYWTDEEYAKWYQKQLRK